MSWLDTLEEIRTKDFRKASRGERDETARDVVNMCSYAAAVVAISPIPFSDVLLMLPIQSGMVMTVGHIYGRRVDSASAKELLLELGAVAGAGMLARQGIKALLPVVGALLTIPAAFAANWAIGRVAMEHFTDPAASRERLREVFKQARREGSSMFSRDAFDRFRKKNEERIRAVAQKVKAKAGGEDADGEATPRATAPKKVPLARKAEKKPLGRKTLGRKPGAKKAAPRKPAR